MRTFEYHETSTLDEALALLRAHGGDATPIAGGTSLVLMMKQGLVQPEVVVDLRRIDALRGIRTTADGGLEIGALETHRAIETSPVVRAFCPALAQTFSRIATVRIRNQATLGGNLVHADPAQDPPPMLLALDAQAVVASPDGERIVPLAEFFVDYFETALHEGELLRLVRIPPLPAGARVTYTKFLPRTEDDYATVAIAAFLVLDDDGRCRDVRLGLGSLGTTPLRARAVEDALRGQVLTPTLIDDAAALVREEVDPLDDVRGSAEYKREMARVWTARTLSGLIRRAA
ncbi:MAG TPA: xanthine dehydrogenase family protein subunit M [Candidatus Acidoferrum sp.]|nr:xanthine dehydrogenase family protein subunit M [Candidatus Acidoferrum sp.]